MNTFDSPSGSTPTRPKQINYWGFASLACGIVSATLAVTAMLGVSVPYLGWAFLTMFGLDDVADATCGDLLFLILGKPGGVIYICVWVASAGAAIALGIVGVMRPSGEPLLFRTVSISGLVFGTIAIIPSYLFVFPVHLAK